MASFFIRINSKLQQISIASSPWRNGKNQSLKPFWVTTLCSYILLSFHAKNIRSKVEAEVWRGLFEGCFLKGNSWCKLGSCTNMYLKSGHNTRNMVFHNGNKYFLKLLSVFTWFLKNFNGLYCLRPHHFFQRIHH